MYRIHRSFISSIVLLCLLQSLLGMPVFAQSPCDSQLGALADDLLAYRLREGRCEGRYIKEVSGTPLLVASLTESFEDYDYNSGINLNVEWTAPGDDSVHVRVYGIRPRLYYRMDIISGSSSYLWPTNLLAALEISQIDLGIVGWSSFLVGGIERRVYLPLRIRQDVGPSRSGTYQVVLLPAFELVDVFVSLAPVEEDGQLGSPLPDWDGKVLEEGGYYPAQRRIAISISELRDQPSGIYHLEFAATLRTGGSTGAKLLFYHHRVDPKNSERR
ncbi:MAG: hypothetical protein O7B35_00470 [Deltaproteobacteria bacterium]|nr:hypothetical protein [Deltaproteobacteria bacterium]